MKRLSSSHFVIKTMPVPSHARSLSRSILLERKMKTSPQYGYVTRHIAVLMCRARICGGVVANRRIFRGFAEFRRHIIIICFLAAAAPNPWVGIA